jgi:hypothetical protein
MSSEHTLELNRLIVGRDEAEYEAEGTISEYLTRRAALYANRLGNGGKKIKEFDMVEDAISGGWVLMFYCERY